MELHELSGILPRTAIFMISECKRLNQYVYDEIKIEISALEIYCDTVRDIFSDKLVKLMTDKNGVLKLEG